MDSWEELGFVCVKCQEGACPACIDVARILWGQSEICKCPRPDHDGEPIHKHIRDPFDDSIHGPNIVIDENGLRFVRSITCPKCGLTSHNPHDIENMYCGNCSQFHCEMEL